MISRYFDEDDMPKALLRALRERGVDATTVQEQGMRHAIDAAQLEFAANAGRVLVTTNIRDFTRLHVEYLSTGRHHAGIIVIQQQRYSVGEQLRRLLRFLNTRTEAEMADWLEYLGQWG